MIIVTGSAGFIGYHLCEQLLSEGHDILGLDNVNDYYDVDLKELRLDRLRKHPQFTFLKTDIASPELMSKIESYASNVTHIIHLAAQAGVRQSKVTPLDYGHANLMGHLNMLDVASQLPKLQHFLYASTSSVYGDGLPISKLDDRADTPLSIYAATKRSGELLASAYNHLYDFEITGVRLFTVYGTYGRPDMAYFSFATKMRQGQPIRVHDDGLLLRDFTHVDDIVGGIKALIQKGNQGHPLFNFGRGHAHSVNDLIVSLEKHLGVKAIRQSAPKERTEMKSTLADISLARDALGFEPKVNLDDGIGHFVTWFKEYSAR